MKHENDMPTQLLENVLLHFPSARKIGVQWVAQCPTHPDRKASLSIEEKNGRILLHCFAGCTLQAICVAAGIEMRELFAQNGDTGHKARKLTVVATYDYSDERGEVLFQVLRFEPKEFRQRRPHGNGWAWHL